MGLTDDPNDPRLTHGADPIDGGPVGQAPVYLILSEAERARGFVRPVRRVYIHDIPGCGAATTMKRALAETYAVDPGYYKATFCSGCQLHRPVGADGEFVWDGTAEKVGT